MKRALLLAAALGLFAGCSQSTTSGAATLVGAHELVLVGDLLFTASTDRNELRALDLVPPNQPVNTRQFARAPNPLEALSIPVLARPAALTADLHFADLVTDAGVIPLAAEVAGPWVYATRAGGTEISVVGAARDQLTEIHFEGKPESRIQAAAPVTATASTSLPDTTSRLFFATWDGDRATLVKLDLPGTLDALKAKTVAQLTSGQQVLTTLDGEVVVDLLVAPGITGRATCGNPARQCLILATRQQRGAGGRVLLLDPDTLESRELHFPGPVRKLAIHGGAFIQDFTDAGVALGIATQALKDWTVANNIAVDAGMDAGPPPPPFVPPPTTLFAPGQRVWGVLAEEKCGGTDCGGVIAVDTLTSEVAHDAFDLPMLKILTGDTLPTGLAIASNGLLLVPAAVTGAGTPLDTNLAALGVTTTSNGSIVFFDAALLTSIDGDGAGPEATAISLYNPSTDLIPNGEIQPYVAGPAVTTDKTTGVRNLTATFADGTWHSEQIQITLQGVVPGLGARTTSDADGLDFPLEPAALARAEVGDTLVIQTPKGECRVAVESISATALHAASPTCVRAAGKCDLTVTGDCQRAQFSVRAGANDPYVIVATGNGYLGRSGPNQTFQWFGTYFERFRDFDPTQPSLVLSFGDGSCVPNSTAMPPVVCPIDAMMNPVPLAEDWQWRIDVDSHFGPFVVGVDSSSIGCSAVLAGGVVLDVALQRLFAAFPSSNGIIELNPGLAARGITAANAVCYR